MLQPEAQHTQAMPEVCSHSVAPGIQDSHIPGYTTSADAPTASPKMELVNAHI